MAVTLTGDYLVKKQVLMPYQGLIKPPEVLHFFGVTFRIGN